MFRSNRPRPAPGPSWLVSWCMNLGSRAEELKLWAVKVVSGVSPDVEPRLPARRPEARVEIQLPAGPVAGRAPLRRARGPTPRAEELKPWAVKVVSGVSPDVEPRLPARRSEARVEIQLPAGPVAGRAPLR